MADTLPTLANLITINDQNALDLGLNDLLQNANLLRSMYALKASNGTQHKYLKRTTAPSAGSRAVNAGIARTFGADTMVTINLPYFDADHICDVAEAKGYKGGATAFIAREIPSQVQSMLWAAEQSVIAAFAATLPNLSTNGMVVNAGGSTANSMSSVYAIRSNGEKEVAIVIGNEGEISVGDTTVTQVKDGSANTFSAYLTTVGGYIAPQIGSIYSLGRIANIGTAANKLTDALIASLLAKAPADRPFTHLVMNRVALSQLQASRTATSPTGAPAPFPTDAFGTPIIVTDAIGNTEAVVS